ncbi:MAG: cation transporter [Deltaproteobacteria bacterium]|nr:cation transporter [Deltaproteobacteria bacterium]
MPSLERGGGRRILLPSKLKASRLLIGTAIILFLVKLAAGLYSGSIAVLSLAGDSLADLCASLIGYFTIIKAEEPADEDHHFGHGKFENFASFAQGLFIFATGCYLIYMAVRKWIAGEEVLRAGTGMVVLGVTTVVSLAASRYASNVAKDTESVVLKTDSFHYAMDVWTNAGAIAALGLVKLTGWVALDPIVAILVSLYIVWQAAIIVKEGFDVLTDKALDEKENRIIREIVKNHYPKVLSARELRTRRSGIHRLINLTLVLCRRISLEEAHDVIDHIEREISEVIPQAHTTTHPEPCECEDPERDCKFFRKEEFTSHLQEEEALWKKS